MIVHVLKRHLLVLFFALISIGTLQAQEVEKHRAYYIGTLGSNLKIQMDLIVDSRSISGSYFYEHIGTPLSLSGKTQSDGALVIEEKDEKEQKTGTFRGKFSDTNTFQGTWTGGKKSFPFKLIKVAEYISLKTYQGTWLDSSSLYPYFLKTSPALSHINDIVDKEMRLQHNNFINTAKEDYSSDGDIVFSMMQQYDNVIEFYSQTLISLNSSVYQYTGGAHGNVYYDSNNYWIKNNKVHLVKLSDLFLPKTPYISVLSDLIIKDLRRQEAPYIVDGSIKGFKEDEITVFLLTPAGIKFSFPPYSVGYYAAGSFFAIVPYKSLMKIINPRGPIKQFIASK